ncbi:amidase [Halococcus sp. IIIV-5B]|uniref:amidase n=1 Tax=Halococcus sp. IIIV-5B TaxID=2321230 RepID=UPI000E76BC39|nr:amidase [Halococcus sp. IIIV-5B]RJT07469.1 amidase [Halococcus sp. IIIV-5B]
MDRYSTDIQKQVRNLSGGKCSVTAHRQSLVDLIKETEPLLHAFVEGTVHEDRIACRYKQLEERRANTGFEPLLYGVAVGVKDLLHVDGLPTRAGSSLPPEALADAESAVVTKLRDAGAVIVGKTETPPFGHRPTPPTRNPHDLKHTPGGSSSGSAAAVGAGVVPLAIGTEAVGSVIRPAAYCGIVGFRPSRGRIPVARTIPATSSTSHVGVFTQRLGGMERVASVVCQNWVSTSTDSACLTVGVPTGAYLKQTSDTGIEAFEEHVRALKRAGFDVRRQQVFNDIAAVNEAHWTLIAFEAAQSHRPWVDEYVDRYPPAVLEVIDRGRAVSIEAAEVATKSMSVTRTEIADAMVTDELDLIVAPPAPGPAPPGIDDDGDPILNLPWTHAGVPAVTLPVDCTDDGLPIGIQCLGRFGRDEQLLADARTVADSV